MATMKNRFGFNPTGGQIDSTLRALVRDTMSSIILHSDFIDRCLPRLLSYLMLERRSKRAAVPMGYALQFIALASGTLHDRERMLELLIDSTVERSVWITVFGNVYTATENYPRMYRKWLVARSPFMRQHYENELSKIESLIGSNRESAYPAIVEFQSRFKLFNDFKNDIVFQYMSLAGSLSQRQAATSANVSVKDLHQSMLVNVSTGIDKYSSKDGAMANYMKYWIINTCSSNAHLTGNAYDVPSTVRKKIAMREHSEINQGVSFDMPLSSDGSGDTTLGDILPGDAESDPAELYVQQTERERLSYAFKRADTSGIFRLSAGLPETFTPQERSTMLKHMDELGIAWA